MTTGTNKYPQVKVEECFYKCLDYRDEKILANVELGIELYSGVHDGKIPGDAAVNFERALGIFSLSYVKMGQDILRARETNLTPEQKLFLNFGIIDSRIIQNDAVVDALLNEIDRNLTEEQFEIMYLNEWMEKIARGKITPTSDTAQVKSKTKSKESEDKLRDRRIKLDAELVALYKHERDNYAEFTELFKLYSPDNAQVEKVKYLTAARKKVALLEHIVNEENTRYIEVENIKIKEADFSGGALESADFSRIKEEFDLLVKVMRSCAARGRLIKNTPVLIDKWIPPDQRLSFNIRENVEKILEESEAIDFSIFLDREGNRKAPKVLIVPGIGTGMAWKDRLMVPLFAPPTLSTDVSIIRTLAGFRWHITTTSYNWKDLPGEIGSMYKLIYPDLSFTNLEKSFTDDYVKWITKEAIGFQVLPPNVRNLFWKKIPFSKEHKKNLAKRATVYAKLMADDAIHGK
ncbi:MAG: hypothetical protein WCX65_07920 [bacterium]